MTQSCIALPCVSVQRVQLHFTLTNASRTVLHPRYKSSYFVKAKWPRDWIATAEDILREHWSVYYKPATADTRTPERAVSSMSFLSLFPSVEIVNVTGLFKFEELLCGTRHV
jgi:hypothetical protein